MFACIYIPNFAVAAALRAEPELQDRPLAIFEGKPPLEKLIAVNEHAKGLGSAPGMTKAQAELCSELTLRPRSSLQESSAHATLLDCAQSFSPCVEIRPRTRSFSIFPAWELCWDRFPKFPEPSSTAPTCLDSKQM